jgi:hypothetical protein
MRRYKVVGVLIILVFIIILSACQNENPGMELIPVPINTNEPVQGEVISTKINPQESQEPIQKTDTLEVVQAYPSPVEVVPYDPYPEPIDGEMVDWDKVEGIILSGEVIEVFQAFTRQVTITLADGRIIISEEPQRDAIFVIINQCGPVCYEIRKLTE